MKKYNNKKYDTLAIIVNYNIRGKSGGDHIFVN